MELDLKEGSLSTKNGMKQRMRVRCTGKKNRKGIPRRRRKRKNRRKYLDNNILVKVDMPVCARNNLNCESFSKHENIVLGEIAIGEFSRVFYQFCNLDAEQLKSLSWDLLVSFAAPAQELQPQIHRLRAAKETAANGKRQRKVHIEQRHPIKPKKNNTI